MTEELRLHERLWDRRAVQGHEGLGRARARVVQCTRHERLARPRLAAEEDRAVHPGELAHQREHLAHSRALAEEAQGGRAGGLGPRQPQSERLAPPLLVEEVLQHDPGVAGEEGQEVSLGVGGLELRQGALGCQEPEHSLSAGERDHGEPPAGESEPGSSGDLVRVPAEGFEVARGDPVESEPCLHRVLALASDAAPLQQVDGGPPKAEELHAPAAEGGGGVLCRERADQLHAGLRHLREALALDLPLGVDAPHVGREPEGLILRPVVQQRPPLTASSCSKSSSALKGLQR